MEMETAINNNNEGEVDRNVDVDVDVDMDIDIDTQEAAIAIDDDPGPDRLNWELHPMKNPCFIRSVFDYLPFTDLKSVRLTGSPLWYSESLKSWKDKAALRISGRPDLDIELGQKGICVGELQDIYYADDDPFLLTSRPFENYILSNFDDCSEDNEAYIWVIQTFADKIKCLILHNCRFKDVPTLLELMFQKLINLETLKIKGEIKFHTIHRERNETEAIEYEVHPNLKCVEFENTTTTTTRLFPSPWQEFMKNLIMNLIGRSVRDEMLGQSRPLDVDVVAVDEQ